MEVININGKEYIGGLDCGDYDRIAQLMRDVEILKRDKQDKLVAGKGIYIYSDGVTISTQPEPLSPPYFEINVTSETAGAMIYVEVDGVQVATGSEIYSGEKPRSYRGTSIRIVGNPDGFVEFGVTWTNSNGTNGVDSWYYNNQTWEKTIAANEFLTARIELH